MKNNKYVENTLALLRAMKEDLRGGFFDKPQDNSDVVPLCTKAIQEFQQEFLGDGMLYGSYRYFSPTDLPRLEEFFQDKIVEAYQIGKRRELDTRLRSLGLEGIKTTW